MKVHSAHPDSHIHTLFSGTSTLSTHTNTHSQGVLFSITTFWQEAQCLPLEKKKRREREKKSIKANKQEWELLPACLHSPPDNRIGSAIRFLYSLPHRSVTQFTAFRFWLFDSFMLQDLVKINQTPAFTQIVIQNKS